MQSPVDAQLFQVHTAYAVVTPLLIQKLVESGSLTPAVGIELLQRAQSFLSNGPNDGEIVQSAYHSIDQTIAWMEIHAAQTPA